MTLRPRPITLVALACVAVTCIGLSLPGCSESLEPASVNVAEIQGAPIDGSEDTGAPVLDSATAGSPTDPSSPTAPIDGLPGGGRQPGPPGGPGKHVGDQHLFGKLSVGKPYKALDKEFLAVNFNRLSAFDAPIAGVKPLDTKEERRASVTPDVEALVGQEIAIEGFMIPYEFDGTNIKVFYLSANSLASCCFGLLPKVNEVIEVHMVEGSAPVTKAPITPVVVAGTFEIDEVNDPIEGLICLFKMRAQVVDLP